MVVMATWTEEALTATDGLDRRGGDVTTWARGTWTSTWTLVGRRAAAGEKDMVTGDVMNAEKTEREMGVGAKVVIGWGSEVEIARGRMVNAEDMVTGDVMNAEKTECEMGVGAKVVIGWGSEVEIARGRMVNAEDVKMSKVEMVVKDWELDSERGGVRMEPGELVVKRMASVVAGEV